MKIKVQVKLKSKQSRLDKIEDVISGETLYIAYIQAPPVEGKANEELMTLVSDYFHIRKSNIKIVNGHASTIKTLEII